nr:hypothetical protein [Tanacetum cinerariifolium]
QNALQTLLPQIRAEIREEFRTSSGPSKAGGNPPLANPHGFEGYSNQKQEMTNPYSSPHFIANCFNAAHLKMEVKVPVSSCLNDS